jgi:hypothetical protein
VRRQRSDLLERSRPSTRWTSRSFARRRERIAHALGHLIVKTLTVCVSQSVCRAALSTLDVLGYYTQCPAADGAR